MSIIVKQLSREQFDAHPIWAKYDAPDDIETIATWGEKGAQIAREIEATGFSDDHYFPVLQLNDGWDGFRCVTIRASITTADGTILPGCVCDTHAHFLRIFAADEDFGFKIHWPDDGHQALLRLRQTISHAISPFFPLHYETGFRTSSGERIAGYFGYGDQARDLLKEKHGVDFQAGDMVRVVALRLDDREMYDSETTGGSPAVGDVGRLVRCYDPSLHSAPFVVACMHRPKDFYETMWHAAFAADELELVSRKATA